MSKQPELWISTNMLKYPILHSISDLPRNYQNINNKNISIIKFFYVDTKKTMHRVQVLIKKLLASGNKNSKYINCVSVGGRSGVSTFARHCSRKFPAKVSSINAARRLSTFENNPSYSVPDAANDNYDPVIGVARNTVPQPEFDKELKNKHFAYTYDNGWDYEFYVPNDQRIVYSISGGPMAGRSNYQTTYYQRVRKNLWQVNWLEETGTIVSLVLDIDNKRVTTLIAFSKGHWENPEIAHGYKKGDLLKWRELSKIGIQTNRYILPEQATINKISDGPGNLKEIELDWPTF